MRWMILLGVLVALTSCGRQEQTVSEASPSSKSGNTSDGGDSPQSRAQPHEAGVVWIFVDGMTKVQGITWMGWPNSVQQALEGLKGVKEIEADLASDRFRIVYDTELVGTEAMLTAIQSAGFSGEVIDAPAAASKSSVRVDLAALPQHVRDAFERAASEGRLVLVDVHGPGWAPCTRMERVTYPSEAVQAELARSYERILLDLAEDADTARLFKPEVIPVAVILDAGGNELARKAGFVPPDDYAAWLKSITR